MGLSFTHCSTFPPGLRASAWQYVTCNHNGWLLYIYTSQGFGTCGHAIPAGNLTRVCRLAAVVHWSRVFCKRSLWMIIENFIAVPPLRCGRDVVCLQQLLLACEMGSSTAARRCKFPEEIQRWALDCYQPASTCAIPMFSCMQGQKSAHCI